MKQENTILDAIKIVFNQQYRNMDKAALIELFNIQNVEKFYSEPCIENLPQIYIELELELSYKGKNSEYFYGENNSLKKPLFGISFECKFDEELGLGLDNNINNGKFHMSIILPNGQHLLDYLIIKLKGL